MPVSACCSYVEIYNERPRDLLLASKTERVPLKIREHPKTGPYVQGLCGLIHILLASLSIALQFQMSYSYTVHATLAT